MENKYFLIGVGGISMSAIALLLKENGCDVAGSDISRNENIEMLEKNGVKCFVGHNEENLKGYTNIIFNSAIKDDNKELQYAKKNGLKIISRAEILGTISREYKNVIAISGSHGKTTTTALLSEVFINAGLNPTIHIGGVMNKTNSNVKIGGKDIFITEACEYKNNFLSLYPKVSIVLNIDKDHMDFFESIEDIKKSFEKFSSQSEVSIINGKIEGFNGKNIKSFGVGKDYDFYINNVKRQKKHYFFDFFDKKTKFSFKIKDYGEHILENIISVIAVSRMFEIDFKTIEKSINSFKGVKRRYFKVGKFKNINVIHDYAHHPTEIEKVTKQTLKNGSMIVVFQPHTFSRTVALFDEFCQCLSVCKKLILYKTYPAREEFLEGGSAFDLYKNLKEKIENCVYVEDYNSAKYQLEKLIKNEKNILILGAGDIENFASFLVKN